MNTALLTGTWRHPQVRLSFSWRNQNLLKAVKALPGRYWNDEHRAWVVEGFGTDPAAWLARHRFALSRDRLSEAANYDLDELFEPVAMLASDRSRVLVRHRFAGYNTVAGLLPGAQWNKTRRVFEATAADFLEADGSTLAAQVITDRSLEAWLDEHRFAPPVPDSHLAKVMCCDGKDETLLAPLIDAVGDVPASFGLDLYPYQRAGALALAAGANYTADEPGAGKTRQVLAAAAIRGVERLLLVVPAVALSVWEREAQAAGVWPTVVTIRSGRKEPALPEAGVVVVSMDLLARREGLAGRLARWQPGAMAVDEAHMLMTYTSARSRTVRTLARLVDGPRWAASGTPMTSGPAQLAAQLDYTSDLERVFGGYAAFMRRYCVRTPYGAWIERKQRRGELARVLAQHVWVRRRKEDVLVTDTGESLLPDLTVSADLVDVPLATYRAAHREVNEVIDAFLAEVPHPSKADIDDFVGSNLPLITRLRTAAGLAKIDLARERVVEWLGQNPKEDDTWPRPLIVWVHHKAVGAALTDALSDVTDVAYWTGATTKAERDRIVADFQAGRIGVLVASIMAANVAVTLTASADMLFVEQEWTPGVMTQAVARCWRIGQERAVSGRIMIAAGTLDEHVSMRLSAKEEVINTLAASSGADAVGLIEVGEGLDARRLLTEMVREREQAGCRSARRLRGA